MDDLHEGREEPEPLLSLAYDELHRLARRAMTEQPKGHTLQTTALLNEAWMRLERSPEANWESHDHFLAVAARAMRSVLIDHARRRGAVKRANGVKVDLDHALELHEERSSDLLAVDEALAKLRAVDPILADIVDMRFFGGLKHPHIARILGLPLRKVERGWATARAWLHMRLEGGERDR